MSTGNAAVIPEPLWDVFSLLRTITSTLALEMGEVVVGSVHYSALFLLALVLMLMVFVINILAKIVVKKTKSRFEGNGGIFTKMIRGGVRKHLSDAKRPFMMILVFAFVTMMASLFVGMMAAAAAGFIAMVMIGAMPYISKRMAPIKRERVAHSGLWVCMAAVVVILAVIIGDIVIKGLPALSLEFITGYRPTREGTAAYCWPSWERWN